MSADPPAREQSGPEEPSPRRARTPGRRSVLSTVGLGAVFTACGVLFGTSARLSGGTSIREDDGDVATVLRRQDGRVEQLTQENAEKQDEIDDLTESFVDDPEQAHQNEELAEATGLSEMRGPGLRVTLSDAPTSARDSHPDVTVDDLVVHQQDMEAYINALWAGGAEAMMLQDQRVVAGSAFRCAGNTLLLQGRVYSPPFTIAAIGDSTRLQAALDAAPGVRIFREWRDYVGLGEKIETLSQVTLPAYQGPLTLIDAHAVKGGS